MPWCMTRPSGMIARNAGARIQAFCFGVMPAKARESGASSNPRADRSTLNRNPLHLVEAHVVAPAIVGLRGAGRGVVRHRGGVFQRAAVFQIRRDTGRPEGVIADLRLDAGLARAGGSWHGMPPKWAQRRGGPLFQE